MKRRRVLSAAAALRRRVLKAEAPIAVSSLGNGFAESSEWTSGGTLTTPEAGVLRVEAALAGQNVAVTRTISPGLSLLGGAFLSFEMLLEGGTSAVRVAAGGNILLNHASSFFDDGWRYVTVAGAEIIGEVSAVESVTSFSVTLLNSGSGAATAQFRNLRYHTPEIEPGVVWVFDDARKNTYDVAWPILEAHGMAGVIGVPTNLVGTGGTYMTEAELHELEAAGWEMTCHGHNHISLATADEATRLSEIRDSRAWLVDHGFNAESALHYVYPSASFNNEVVALMRTEGVKTARAGQPRHVATPGIDDHPRIKSRFLQDGWTVEDTTPYLDRLAERGGVVIFTMHGLEDPPASGNWYPDRFEQVVEYAANLGLRSYKFRELWPT